MVIDNAPTAHPSTSLWYCPQTSLAGHDCARGARLPKANAAYWLAKIGRNRARDIAVREKLEADGWRALVVWECELKDEPALKNRLAGFLQD